VLLQTREGRPQRSKVVKNNANPQYNEEFFLLVDDLEHQKLSIKVRSAASSQTWCQELHLLAATPGAAPPPPKAAAS
jgi:Ca2+-dependent lipid-binding protein